MYKKGFTIVELLAVLLIIGLLIGIAVPAFMKLGTKTNERTLLKEAELIEQASVIYISRNANAIKSRINAYISEEARKNAINTGQNVCSGDYCFVKDTIKGSGNNQNDDDYKYKFYINLKNLIASGDYKRDSDYKDGDACSVKNPLDKTKCLDCIPIQIILDDNTRNASAYFGKNASNESNYVVTEITTYVNELGTNTSCSAVNITAG